MGLTGGVPARFFGLALCVAGVLAGEEGVPSMSSPEETRTASYRTVTRFEEGVALRFPALTLTFEGERWAPLARAAVPGVRLLRFRACAGQEHAVVEWSPGLGAVAPREFSVGGRVYKLELAHSLLLGQALAPDELVLCEKPSGAIGAIGQWEGLTGEEFAILLLMSDARSGAVQGLAAELRVHGDGRVEAALVRREALRRVTDAVEEIGRRSSLYVNEPSPSGLGDRSRPVRRGAPLWPLAVAQTLEGLVPYRVDWERSGPVHAAP